MSNATTRNFGAAQRERARRVGLDLEGSLPIGSLAVTGDPAGDAFFGSLHEQEALARANGQGFRADLGSIGRFADQPDGGGRLTATDRAGIAGNVGLAGFTDANAARQLALKHAVDQERDAAIADAQGAYQQHVLDSVAQPREEGSITSTTEGAGAPSATYTGPLGTSRPDVRAGDRYTVRGLPDAHPLSRRQQIMARVPGSMVPETDAALGPAERADQALEIARRAQVATAAANAPFVAPKDAQGVPLTGKAVLSTLPEAKQKVVQAVLEGRQAIPTGAALKDPYWKGIIEAANTVDPNFDTVNYNGRAQTRTDFTKGKAAGQINAINTVVGHLHDLAGAGEKLGNTGIDWVNSVYNKLTPGGTDRGVAINNFSTLKEGVANELMRVWRQVGAGSEKEIEDWKATIGETKSPEELRGAFSTIAGMLESKLDALDTQYKQGMGTDAVSAISPESRAKLNTLGGGKREAATTQEADPRFSTPVEGAQKGIPGIPGGLAKFTNGKWIRVQ